MITSKELTTILGISARQARNIASRLETLGFNVQRGLFGERKIPEPVVEAVKVARKADKPLEALLGDPSLSSFRSVNMVDPLQVLIEARADLSVLRQAVHPMVSVLEGLPNVSFNWSELGIPDPQSEEF